MSGVRSVCPPVVVWYGCVCQAAPARTRVDTHVEEGSPVNSIHVLALVALLPWPWMDGSGNSTVRHDTCQTKGHWRIRYIMYSQVQYLPT